MNILLVASGGSIGSILRYYLSLKAQKRLMGTWIANVSGSIILAIVLLLYTRGSLSQGWWLFLGIGFCGSYTTFSTFGNELLMLLQEKKYIRAITYVLTSIGISLFFVSWILYVT